MKVSRLLFATLAFTLLAGERCPAAPRRTNPLGGPDRQTPPNRSITADGLISKWNPHDHALWVRQAKTDRDVVLCTDFSLHVLRGGKPANPAELSVGQKVKVTYLRQGGVNRVQIVDIEAAAFASSAWAPASRSTPRS